jgi:hypothetical protein
MRCPRNFGHADEFMRLRPTTLLVSRARARKQVSAPRHAFVGEGFFTVEWSRQSIFGLWLSVSRTDLEAS